jgi:hypothetical protein
LARFQKTSIAGDSRGGNRPSAILEPELGGEIALRHASADHGSGVAQLTVPRRQGTSGVSLAARPHAALQVADFERVEDYLRAYLEDERFRSIHPLACGRWIVAWEMLWCADTRAKVLAVGHRAREAMQAFASSLLEQCIPTELDALWPQEFAAGSPGPDPLDGLLAVIGAYGQELAEERHGLLLRLLDHWRALLDRVQRHEGRLVDGRLSWEDGRRLVLFTALVMVETDRSFD